MTNEEFVKVSKALSDATRVEILQIISKYGTICACKILERLHISQGTLSHHMRVLSDLKLVSVEKEGKWCNYSLMRGTSAKSHISSRASAPKKQSTLIRAAVNS